MYYDYEVVRIGPLFHNPLISVAQVSPVAQVTKGPGAKNKLGPQLNFNFYQYKPKYK